MVKKKKKIKVPFWFKGIFLSLCGLVMALSLVSYHKWDSAWNTASKLPTLNWLGAMGAWLADAGLQMFGVVVFVVPVALIVFGVFLLLKKNG